MQLSTKFLKKLIKEEIESLLSEEDNDTFASDDEGPEEEYHSDLGDEAEEIEEQEDEPTEGGFKFKPDPNAAQAAVIQGFKLK